MPTEKDFKQAAARVIKILDRWGVDTSYARPSMTCQGDGIEFALDQNFIKFLIRRSGLFVQSSHAMFTHWYGPITSEQDFKKGWQGHIRFHCRKRN